MKLRADADRVVQILLERWDIRERTEHLVERTLLDLRPRLPTAKRGLTDSQKLGEFLLRKAELLPDVSNLLR